MKKVYLFLLVTALLICAVSIALADVVPGEEVTVTLKLENTNAAFVLVKADYDRTVFDLVGYSCSREKGQTGWNGIGVYDTQVLSSGKIGTVTLKVKDTAELGSYAVSGIVVECYDINENEGIASVIGGTVKVVDKVSVKSVKLDNTEVTLNIGATVTLNATISPSNATDKTLKWKSSDKNVATVGSSSGKVTAKGVGTATITATAQDGSGKKATCTVTVKNLVTSVKLNKSTVLLNIGKTTTLKATVLPEDATDKTLKWKSSDKNVATVGSSSGKVTAIGVGTATITATARDGSGQKATCTVTVKNLVTSVKLNKSEVLLNIGKTTTLKATVKPTDATDGSVKWTSSDKKVATVNSSGKVTAKGVGTATITAAAQDGSGKKATCTVTVKNLVTSVKLNKSTVLLNIGKTTTLKATVLPDDATDSSVKWSSSDKNVATVSSSGKVTAVSVGTATITVTARDGSGKNATCTVTVKNLVTSVKLNKSEVLLNIGKTTTLKATVKPTDATDGSVKWSSSDKNVATVSSSGKVTAKGVGTATITAAARDGSGKKATCTVTVKNLVTSIVLNKTSASLKVNGTVTLKATVSPDDATDKTVKWTSSNTAVAKVSSSGKVTAVGKGTATITVTAQDGSGKKATCTITVK